MINRKMRLKIKQLTIQMKKSDLKILALIHINQEVFKLE